MTEKPTPVGDTTPTWGAGFRRRIPFYVFGAVLLAIMAGILTFIYLDRLQREAMPVQRALVALQHLEPGVEINESMVELRSVPEGVRPVNALGQVGEAVGRIPARPIMVNEILQATDFVGESGAGLSARLPDGRWAMVLPVGWLASPLPGLQAGDQLDMLAYLPGQPFDEVGVIVTAVEILETRGEAVSPDQLVLAITLEDATSVLYARANGFSLLALLRPESR